MSLYAVLGVGPGAKDQDVRRAFRKLALRLHPDKNNGMESEEWLLVQSAYEVLGDKETREEYDILGGNFEAWASDPNRPQPGGVAPDMAAYMAQQHEWRQHRATKDAARRHRREAEARQKDTDEFLSGVDAAMRSAAEACQRRYQPSGPHAAAPKSPEGATEKESLQEVIDMLRKKREKKLREDLEEREKAERQKVEDIEWLRRQWEVALDHQIEQDHAEYEREREQRRQSTQDKEKSQLSEADAMIAEAKAEMEAMMAGMST